MIKVITRTINRIDMKNINNYIKIISLVLFFALYSCENFEEINTNPDTTTEASASLLCTKVILAITEYSSEDKAFITESVLSKYLGYANEGQMNEQYNKLGSSSFGGMTLLPNIEKMVEYAEGNQGENSYKGVAKFARAYLFYNLTMKMGDIPYSEASQGADGVYQPSYDEQESIFISILNELEEADEYFSYGEDFDGDPTPYDGNADSWRKATNTLALKILMSLSEKTDVSSLDVKNRFSSIVSSGNIMEESTGFFGLEYSSQDLYPLNSTNDLFTSKTILSSLFLDMLKNLNDRRMYYYAEPSGAQILGGLTETDPDAYVGVDVDMVYAEMNANHSADVYSLVNNRYREEDDCEPRMLLTYEEQQLILAEARIKGWISSGTAQEYYEQGVKAALTTVMGYNADYAHGMAIDQDYIDNYFADEAAFKATTTEQLEQIWSQRYILNFFQDAPGSFFEYRRTGYPDFPINPETSLNENDKNAIPMRWLYPDSESTYNRDNLTEALDRQYDGYDEINKLMWLLK